MRQMYVCCPMFIYKPCEAIERKKHEISHINPRCTRTCTALVVMAAYPLCVASPCIIWFVYSGLCPAIAGLRDEKHLGETDAYACRHLTPKAYIISSAHAIETPPPPHSVARPRVLPRFFMAYRSVTMMRQPVDPTG